MRILIAEDEAAIRSGLASKLQEKGYIVDEAENGVDALHLGLEYPIDLAVIDLGMPKMDGIEVIKQLRSQGKEFPILILTARSRWQEKVEGLEAGADDYLTKPFHIEELLARVNVLIRRVAGQSNNVLQNGELSLDVSSQAVSLSGSDIDLTAYEYRLLHYLMLNIDKVVSKTELVEHIYLKPIETLRGRGYRLKGLSNGD